ncbi:MAG: OmpA family protein [Bacteroidota bacterium]
MFSRIAISITCFLIFTGSRAQVRIDSAGKVAYLVKKVLLGEGVSVSNMKYTGSSKCVAGFNADSVDLPIKKGVVFSTGYAEEVKGPNYDESHSGYVNTAGDKDLKKISGHNTFDAVILEFDFIPSNNFISFNYIFASEEYLEYVNSIYNDVFAFIVTGPDKKQKNLAVIPNSKSAVTVNNINPEKNSPYYIDNPVMKKGKKEKKGSLRQALQFDGLTVQLTAECEVTPGAKYHIKIAIADAGDPGFDSAVFLEAGSFSSNKTSVLATKSFPKPVEEKPGTESKPVLVKSDSLPKPVSVSNILFASDSYALSAASKTELNKLADLLQKNPAYRVELSGFTDSTASYEYNVKLSLNRAKSVADYLISKGLKPERISYKGFSKDKPVADNGNEEGRALNRRVEVVIKKPQ